MRQHIQIPLVGIAILLSITAADQRENVAAHCLSFERVGSLAVYVRPGLQANLDNHAHVVTVLEAAQQAANASNGALEVTYTPGVKVQSVDTSGDHLPARSRVVRTLF